MHDMRVSNNFSSKYYKYKLTFPHCYTSNFETFRSPDRFPATSRISVRLKRGKIARPQSKHAFWQLCYNLNAKIDIDVKYELPTKYVITGHAECGWLLNQDMNEKISMSKVYFIQKKKNAQNSNINFIFIKILASHRKKCKKS